MKDGTRQAKRQGVRAKGKSPSGPSGYQAVRWGTMSYDDRFGERLVTRCMARMPEPHTATLKSPLTHEVIGALMARPDLCVVNVADGAADNWTSLRATVPFGDEGLDCYHASDHLREALQAADTEGTPTAQKRWATLSAVRRDGPPGVDNVIDALCRWRSRYPRRQAIHKTIAYFREHRPRRSRSRPARTIVAHRLGRGGSRGQKPGGSAAQALRDALASARWAGDFDVSCFVSKRTI